MYLSKFTRKKSKIKPSKSQKQTTRKQSKKKSMKPFLFPIQSNITESKSASETTIDSIISNITKQNISDDEKIQMICEKLSHLETINFYGVLTLPYIKSKVSKGEYDGGQTLGGAKKRETDAQLLDKLDSVEKIEYELTKIDRNINTIEEKKGKNEKNIAEKKESADEIAKKLIDPRTTQREKPALQKKAETAKQAIQSLESKTHDYNKELSSLANTRQALVDKKETLIEDAKKREDGETERRRQTAAELAQTAWRERRFRRETEILTRCLENYQQQLTEFENLLGKIEADKKKFIDQSISIDSRFGPMTSDNIITRIRTKLENINKTNYDNRLLDYKNERQRMLQYQTLERKLVNSTDAVDNCKRRIRRLRAAIPPRVFTEAERIDLRCEDQFIIDDADCNKVYRLVQSGGMTRALGLEILDVWLENTRRMIELEKELFSKGYKGSNYLTNYDIYKEEFDKIDSNTLVDKLNDAFETTRTRAAHTKVKTIPLSEAGSGFMCIFYSDFDKTTAIQRATLDQRRDNFHFTLHLDEGDPAIHEDLPHRNINKYSSGSIHLTAAPGMNMYKANMRPYIFEKDTDQPPIDRFIGSPRCIQILPVYPGDAIGTSEVIYVGRIVTDTLNTYLKELAIGSQMQIKEAEHNFNFREYTYIPIITELQSQLPKQLKLVKKQRHLANIQIFEATLATIDADFLQQIEVFRADDECKIFFERRIKEPYEGTLGAAEQELINKKDKLKGFNENGMDPDILVKIARQGVNLGEVFPSEIFPEGGHINLTDIAAIAAAEAAAEGKYKRKKYTRKRLNKVSKKRRYKILRNRTNKQAIYKIKSKINKNKQK